MFFIIFFKFYFFSDLIINISLINSDRAIESGIANISNIDTVSNKHTTPIKLLINSILESFLMVVMTIDPNILAKT